MTEKTHTLGIDVSHHQPTTLDYPMLYGLGYRFVIIRRAFGLELDHAFWSHRTEARKAGFLVGAYQYLRPQSTIQQVETILPAAHLDGLPFAVDFEASTLDGGHLRSWVDLFTKAMDYWPIIYTSASVWRRQVGGVRLGLCSCPLWVADYRKNRSPELPQEWHNWRIWQTSDEVDTGTSVISLDSNVYRGTLTDLVKWSRDHRRVNFLPEEVSMK